MRKIIFIIITGILTTGIFLYLMLVYTNEASKAAQSNVISVDNLSADSEVTKEGGVVFLDLYTKDIPTMNQPQGVAGDANDSLFNTATRNDAAILEFIKKSPQVPDSVVNKDEGDNKDVKGIFFSNNSSTLQRILPTNFEGDLIRRVDDRSDPYLNRFAQLDNYAVHHYYNQKINGIPVFAATLAVHAVDNQIYGISGNLVNSVSTETKVITEEKAKEIAITQAQKEVDPQIPLSIQEVKEYIFNKKAIGLSSDETNYITLAVRVHSANEVDAFDTEYFVDLKSGLILHSETHILDALNRTIYNCANGSCTIARREGGAAVNDDQVDNAYDIAKDTYDYFMTNHQRDSYNGAGGGLNINVRYPQSCPNAFWANNRANFCNGMVTKDVVAHELTHGITQYSAGLIYSNQSGALNESFSDIFGSTINGTWSIGVGSIMGEIRRMDDPTDPRPANPATKRPQPDKLYSQYYYCQSGDSGGVHVNSGVLNKAFYLMTDGGSFNNCTITGQGREKTAAVAYRALTRYLNSSSNILAAFNAMNTACNELYASEPDVCSEIKKAMEATQMDKQASGSQAGPMCAAQRPAEPPATCVGAATQPSPTGGATNPSPTGGTSTIPKPTSVTIVRNTTQTNTININLGNINQSVRAYQVQRRTKAAGETSFGNWSDFGVFLVGQAISDTIDPAITYQYQIRSCSDTQCNENKSDYLLTEEVVYANVPTPGQNPNPTLAEGGDTTVSLKLKFQGILSKPSQVPASFPAKITLSSETGRKYEGSANLTAGDNGVWIGSLPLSAFEAGRYKLYVKGPKHIQKKICDLNPTEISPGTYRCRSTSWITLQKGANTVDFSGVILLSGDLAIPTQDGIVNALDISFIRNNIGNTDTDTIQKCDVNLDGQCDTQDYSLVIAALAVRYDEE